MTRSRESRVYAHPPFTNEEAFRALAVFAPDVTVEAARREFPGGPGDPFLGYVTTGVLLVLATFSEELASRVVAYDPDLEREVLEARRDPEGFIRSLRDDVDEDGPPRGATPGEA